MAVAAEFPGDVNVAGHLNVSSMTIPANSLGNAGAKASDPFEVDKSFHRNVINFSQLQSTDVSAERRPVYISKSAGVFSRMRSTLCVAHTGDSTCTIDVYKNGTTCLSATVTITSSTTAYTLVTGTPAASGVYAAGDVFEVVVTVSAGTGTLGNGLIVNLTFDERP